MLEPCFQSGRESIQVGGFCLWDEAVLGCGAQSLFGVGSPTARIGCLCFGLLPVCQLGLQIVPAGCLSSLLRALGAYCAVTLVVRFQIAGNGHAA